jgi:hypothetical protein
LLVLFTAVLATVLASGRRASCACFGSSSARPVGVTHLLRNLALLGAAAVVLVTPPDLPGWAAQWLVVAVTVIVVQAWLLASRPPIPIATTLIATDATAAMGATSATTMRVLAEHGLAGRQVVAVFVDPSCGPCQRLLSGVAGWRSAVGDTAVVLVAAGPLPYETALAGVVDVILHDPGTVLSSQLGVPGTPAAVLLDGDGMPVQAPALGLDAVRAMLHQVREVLAPDGALPPAIESLLPASPAPPGILGRDLGTGHLVPSADPDGRWTVVLQTAHNCPDCVDMVTAARRRNLEPRHRLVILGTVDFPTARAGLVVDDDRAFARAVGLDGAPGVVVLDGAGRPLASPATGTASTLATLQALAT